MKAVVQADADSQSEARQNPEAPSVLHYKESPESSLAFQAALCFNTSVMKTGVPTSEIIDSYANFSGKYDELFCEGVYNGPKIAGQILAEHISESQRKKIKVLDIGAGTGKVGSALSKLKFANIDGLEPCGALLRRLEARGHYRKTIQEAVGREQLSIPRDSYDVTVCVGSFGAGHVPLKGIDDMILVTKHGGLILVVMRHEFLWTVPDYKNRMEPYMEGLQALNLWTRVEKRIIPRYAFNRDGVAFLYRVFNNNC